MRRKTFDVLFSTRDGMEMLVKEKCLWRSLWYFTMSVGLFCGVITNQLFLEQPLSVRFGIIAVVLVITGVCLLMYGFLLHGILCTMGALSRAAIITVFTGPLTPLRLTPPFFNASAVRRTSFMAATLSSNKFFITNPVKY